MSTESIRLSGVSKIQKTPFSRRPGFRVGPLDFSVGDGEIVGLLGANGAGKTTTLKLIMGLLTPDSGHIELVGSPSTSRTWRSQVGYLPEQPAFYDYLSGREFLAFAAELFGLERAVSRARISSLLEQVGISASADRAIRTYSKGMQQRLGLAQALLNEPRLLVLDEPMSGLDPLGRRLVRDLLLDLKARGCSILFSTHIIPDAEFICDRIALMRTGSLVSVGTLDELLGLPSEFEIASTTPPPLDQPGLTAAGRSQRSTVRVSKAELAGAIDRLVLQKSHLVSVSPIRASIEDLLATEQKERP